MFNDLDSKAKEALIGNYIDYVSKKYNYKNNNNKVNNMGIYSSKSFDDYCDLVNYERPYNIMFNDYDENNIINLSNISINDDFIDYINEYNNDLVNRGAKMYYSFSPMNKKSINNNQFEIDSFYFKFRDKLNFPIISDINNYIMDYEWFYDSNYHLNYSGMRLRTFFLVEDLKNELGITTKTNFNMVEKPTKPSDEIIGEGDNSYSDCFIYEKNDNYYKIIGLTEKGYQKEELVIPYQINGIYVNEFTNDTFSYNKKVKKL